MHGVNQCPYHYYLKKDLNPVVIVYMLRKQFKDLYKKLGEARKSSYLDV